MTELCKCKHCKMLPTLYALDVEGSELEWNDYMDCTSWEYREKGNAPSFDEWLCGEADSWLVCCSCGWMYGAGTRDKAVEMWNKGMKE